MKIILGFIWFICKICWFVVMGLFYVLSTGAVVSLLCTIGMFIIFGLEEKQMMIKLFITGVICMPLAVGCFLLAEKVGDICDDMASDIAEP